MMIRPFRPPTVVDMYPSPGTEPPAEPAGVVPAEPTPPDGWRGMTRALFARRRTQLESPQHEPPEPPADSDLADPDAEGWRQVTRSLFTRNTSN